MVLISRAGNVEVKCVGRNVVDATCVAGQTYYTDVH